MYKLITVLALLVILISSQGIADSLWSEDSATSLFVDRKAAKVGDIVTVMIVEGASATQQASSGFGKDVDHSNSAGLGPLMKLLPEFGFSSSQSGSARGQTTMSNQLITRLSATVVKEQENGNLEIEGSRILETNGEKQEIKFSATVRPDDIGTDNTVTSTSLADVRIHYSGKGPVGDRQKEGIITKLIKWLF